MLKIIGSMRKIVLARDEESLRGLRAAAEKSGAKVDLEQRGNRLFGRSIFLGYDLPNGNGDAIPSFYASDFGPSFIDKHLDYEHREDDDNIIGKIRATWHVENQIPLGEGPRIIGRNAFGRDLDGRPPLFRLLSGQGEPINGFLRELQVEGIFEINRETKMGDIVARRLLSGEMDSVSQEASTAFCQCSVCGHKIQFPFDPICDHLLSGHLMIRSWKVKGYDEEVLGYKVHHDPVGTGLGVVQVPAFDRAKVLEMTAALKSGQMSYEAALAIVREHERMMGAEVDRNLITAAVHDFETIAKDKAKTKPIYVGGEFSAAKGSAAEVKANFNPGEMMDDPEHPFVVWNAYDEMPAFPESFATLEEARAAAESKMAAWRTQGYYKTIDGIRVPADRLKVVELGPGTSIEDQEGAVLIISDDRKPDGSVVEASYGGEYPPEFLAEVPRLLRQHAKEAFKSGSIKPSELDPALEDTEENVLKVLRGDREAIPSLYTEWLDRHPEVAASIKAGSQVVLSFSAKENTKGEENDEVEARVKPDSDIVGRVLQAAGFERVSDGVYAIRGNSVPAAKQAFEKAFAAQGQDRVGVSIMEEGPNTYVLEHMAPAVAASKDYHKIVNALSEDQLADYDEPKESGKIREEAHDMVDAGDRDFLRFLDAFDIEASGKVELPVSHIKKDLEEFKDIKKNVEEAIADDEEALKNAPRVDASDALLRAIAATMPSEKDGPEALAAKVHTAAVIEARLNRETYSVVRHAHLAAALGARGELPAAAILEGANRAGRLAVFQSALDSSKAAMAARTALELPAESGEGAVPAWTMRHAAQGLDGATFDYPRFIRALSEIDRAMPCIVGFHARMDSARYVGSPLRSRLAAPAKLAAVMADHDALHRKIDAEAKKPGAFGARSIEKSASRLAASLEALASEELSEKFSMAAMAAVERAIGKSAPSFAARRLRLPEGALNTVKAAVASQDPGIALAALGVVAAHTEAHLSRAEKEAVKVLASAKVLNSADAYDMAVAGSALCVDVALSPIVKAADSFMRRHLILAKDLLSMERKAAMRRTITAAWAKVFDADPSADPRTSYAEVVAAAKCPVPMAVRAGIRIQSAGGLWPWTSQGEVGKETWPQFIEARSDEELEQAANDWEARLKTAVGFEAKATIESNVRRLRSVLDARRQARGLSASLIGSPDPLGAYWAVRGSDGRVIMRVPLRRILGGRRDALAVKWAGSARYGQALVAKALAFGVKALEAQLFPVAVAKSDRGRPWEEHPDESKRTGTQWEVVRYYGGSPRDRKYFGSEAEADKYAAELEAQHPDDDIEVYPHPDFRRRKKASLVGMASGVVKVSIHDEIVTRESAAEADIDHDRSGASGESTFDRIGGADVVADIADFLKREGVTGASDSHFRPGVWYTTEPSEDYASGDTESRSYHIEGLTPEEERELWNAMKVGPASESAWTRPRAAKDIAREVAEMLLYDGIAKEVEDRDSEFGKKLNHRDFVQPQQDILNTVPDALRSAGIDPDPLLDAVEMRVRENPKELEGGDVWRAWERLSDYGVGQDQVYEALEAYSAAKGSEVSAAGAPFKRGDMVRYAGDSPDMKHLEGRTFRVESVVPDDDTTIMRGQTVFREMMPDGKVGPMHHHLPTSSLQKVETPPERGGK